MSCIFLGDHIVVVVLTVVETTEAAQPCNYGTFCKFFKTDDAYVTWMREKSKNHLPKDSHSTPTKVLSAASSYTRYFTVWGVE